jgi:hypothetical protein
MAIVTNLEIIDKCIKLRLEPFEVIRGREIYSIDTESIKES